MKSISAVICLSLILAAPVLGQQPPAMVKTATAEQGLAANYADMIGTLYFDRTSRVSPEESARITEVGFREGDRIQKGDVMIRLDSRILRAEIALHKARLAQVEIRLENTRLDLERYTRLFKSQVATEADYDDLRFAHSDLQQELVALSRQLDILNIRLAKYVVRAPFDGIILEKQAEVGEWVNPGSPLCVLGATDALYADVPVAENLVRFVRNGDELPLLLNAVGREMTGIVEGIRPRADARTRNVSLKIRLVYDGPVAENMSATVQVPVSEKQPVVLIPRDGLVQVMGTDMVFTVEDGKAAGMPVDIRYSRGDRIGIAMGAVKPGMTVVVDGNERLRPGQAVIVQGE